MLSFERRQKLKNTAIRWHARLTGRQVVHVLHIGKTGGTAIKNAMGEHTKTRTHTIFYHGHGIAFDDVPRGEQIIFFLRDPVSRFVSGFWSRYRLGHPGHEINWTESERAAFERFPTPAELAAGLGAEDADTRAAAEQAMGGIFHLKAGFSRWLHGMEYLRNRDEDVLYVGYQESLATDFTNIKALLSMPDAVALPSDKHKANRGPSEHSDNLDDQARETIKNWYAGDYEILAYTRQLMAERQNGS